MANLAALIANKGYYYTPHLIKSMGMNHQKPKKYTTKNDVGIDSAYYSFVHEAMAAAVYGTAGRAAMQDIEICGKTGTAENFAIVNGKRVQLEDHSVFMAFAPQRRSQNCHCCICRKCRLGWQAAASTASLMIEKYLKGCVDRTSLEEFVLKGDFIY